MLEIMRLPARPASAAVARRWAATVLAGWGHGTRGDIVVLLTSEVVTNAVVHGPPAGGAAVVVVSLDCSDHRARVEVGDSSSLRPALGTPGPDNESGRGLMLVDTLASTWGVTPSGTGKVVWFEVTAR